MGVQEPGASEPGAPQPLGQVVSGAPGQQGPPKRWPAALCSLLARGPASCLAVQIKPADSCSRYKPNDHERALIFFLQAHFLGNQAHDMLIQIGRLELKRQK